MKKLLLILTILITSACSKQATIPAQPPTVTTPQPDNMPASHSFTYLALGDSYTIGEAVPQAQSFPYQLTQRLKNTNNPDIIAVTGWTTGELKQGIAQRALSNHNYDIVTLLIGVNNQYRGYNKEAYRTEFTELLNTAIAYANGNKKHVFVLSIPDWGVTPFGKNSGDPAKIAADIDTFNAINKQETDMLGVAYVDITPISRQAAYDTDLVASDGLHPSGKMYSLWVNELLSLVTAQVKHGSD
ncbi:SGNH/GDSL hydrolase family protein [Mucilaginibacter litoreus]|uniref:SGNH/GDSL hydrolase family protein n=1 Tax=Mucilaginibacter litoreus TaxID=1048221 RepID=A0ABW3AW12_9SPHI